VLAGATLVSLFSHATVAAARPRPEPTPYGAAVPAGVEIPVELVTQINSATFNVGDSFAFKTAAETKLSDSKSPDGVIDVPKGTPGHGRIANVVRADNKHNGDVTLQVDSIDMPDGTPIWVNIDPKSRVQGHLADKRTRFLVVAVATDFSGNMVLEPGTPFKVVTIPRRAAPAPLVTAAPTPLPTPSLMPSPVVSGR
jgi:hypothetical protein